jgi:ribosomal-protein-alanine N-acetyltransferase
MNTYNFQPMTEEYASTICNWKYHGPYSIYSMDGSYECICELMNSEYFYVMDNENSLVGYICSGNSARVPGGYQIGIYDNSKHLDIGLGLKPDFTGKGIGQQFLSQGINFLKEQFKVQSFQLVVAMFNERAIKVYERTGFIKGLSFKSKVDDQEIDFIVMRNSMKNE